MGLWPSGNFETDDFTGDLPSYLENNKDEQVRIVSEEVAKRRQIKVQFRVQCLYRKDSILSNFVEAFEHTGSGKEFVRVEKFTILVIDFKPSRVGRYLPLPKRIASSEACLNVHNQDDFCLKYCLAIHRNLATNPAIANNLNKPHAVKNGVPTLEPTKKFKKAFETLNFEGVEFPCNLDQLKLVEDLNKVNIMVYALDNNNLPYQYRWSDMPHPGDTMILLMLHAAPEPGELSTDDDSEAEDEPTCEVDGEIEDWNMPFEDQKARRALPLFRKEELLAKHKITSPCSNGRNGQPILSFPDPESTKISQTPSPPTRAIKSQGGVREHPEPADG
ncbi:hypothetical protein WJX72_011643 [[Myrmecia] bisecta]|uniref:Uncharacterized protein n=1 Tax=[Myrmecia] bisecta TaxID=41462 RepID=A0AAW1P428_9CHLO